MKTLKIPRSIKILGMTWKIRRLYSSQMPRDDEGYPSWGATHYGEQRILLDRSCPPERMTLNLCHEIGHILADAAGIAPPRTEQWAQQLERPLASLLTDNDWRTE